MSKPTIGFIGLGLMGRAMVGCLQDAGYDVSVLGNRDRSGIEEAVARGGTEAGSAREMAAGCDIVMLCVGTSEQVEQRIYGEDGVLVGSKAVKLYARAVEGGNAWAMNNLAVCHKNGTGVEKNLPEAVKLYTQAVEKGNANAMCNLGWCHEYGKGGLSVDVSEARRHYQMAADQGQSHAITALARLDGNNAP